MTNEWMSYRASHDDRTQVEAELRSAYQDGRLSVSDLEDRLEQTYQALTYRDLLSLVSDLPNGPDLIERIGNPRYKMQAPASARTCQPVQRPLVSAYPMLTVAAAAVLFPFLLMVLVTILPFAQGFAPFFIMAGFFWMIRGRRRPRRRSGWYR